jgi:hypothetical protein
MNGLGDPYRVVEVVLVVARGRHRIVVTRCVDVVAAAMSCDRPGGRRGRCCHGVVDVVVAPGS